MNKLIEDKLITYEWFVCNCSACERSYQIKINDKWVKIGYCPFCGKMVPPLSGWILNLEPEPIKINITINGEKVQ